MLTSSPFSASVVAYARLPALRTRACRRQETIAAREDCHPTQLRTFRWSLTGRLDAVSVSTGVTCDQLAIRVRVSRGHSVSRTEGADCYRLPEEAAFVCLGFSRRGRLVGVAWVSRSSSWYPSVSPSSSGRYPSLCPTVRNPPTVSVSAGVGVAVALSAVERSDPLLESSAVPSPVGCCALVPKISVSISCW